MEQDELYEIPEISDTALLDIDTDAEWDKLSAQLGFKNKEKIFRLNTLLKIAAAVLIIAATSVLILNNKGKTETQTFASVNSPIETIVENSTHISLNCNSTITCTNTNNNTFSVNLQGEAYFDVEKNQQRTFEINTKNIKVIVHGTSFNICEQGENTTVVVTSGIVEVIANKDGKSVTITKDKQLTCNNNGNMQVNDIDNYNTIGWKFKEFKFNDTQLGEIMQQLSHAYNFSYQFETPELAENRISGSFSKQKIETIIEILEQTLDNIKFEKTPEGDYIIK